MRLAGVERVGSRKKGTATGNTEPAATTDGEGRFVLKYREDRLVRFSVAMEHGFSPTVMDFDGVRPGAQEQMFIVPQDALPSARIQGRVLTPDGRPATAVAMSLRQKWPVHPKPTPYSDDDGLFEIGIRYPAFPRP